MDDSILETLDDDFLKYLSKKTLDYEEEFVEANWDDQAERLNTEAQDILLNIGVFRATIFGILHERKGEEE